MKWFVVFFFVSGQVSVARDSDHHAVGFMTKSQCEMNIRGWTVGNNVLMVACLEGMAP